MLNRCFVFPVLLISRDVFANMSGGCPCVERPSVSPFSSCPGGAFALVGSEREICWYLTLGVRLRTPLIVHVVCHSPAAPADAREVSFSVVLNACKSEAY